MTLSDKLTLAGTVVAVANFAFTLYMLGFKFGKWQGALDEFKSYVIRELATMREAIFIPRTAVKVPVSEK